MKNLVFVLSVCVAGLIKMSAQNNNSITVFTEGGERFYLILNGVKQNSNPETNVKAVGINGQQVKAKVIFDQRGIPDCDKTIPMMWAAELVSNTEFVFSIRKNKKGQYKWEFVSQAPTQGTVNGNAGVNTNQNNYSGSNNFSGTNTNSNQNENVGINTNMNVNNGNANSVTTTTSVTNTGTNTGNTGLGINIGFNGTGINMNVNDGGLGNNVNTTTTTTTSYTTTTTNNGVTQTQTGTNVQTNAGYNGVNMNVNGGGINQGNPNYGNSNVNVNTNINPNGMNNTGANTNFNANTNATNFNSSQNGYNNNSPNQGCAVPMSIAEFNDAKKSVQSKSFDDTKLKIAKQVADNNCLSVEQIKGMMSLFSFENNKLDFAKYAYDRCTEKKNYYKVGDVFTFDSNVEELNEYINSKK